MAKKTSRPTTARSKTAKKPKGRLQSVLYGLRRSPKKSLFILTFAVVSTLLVIGALALCAPPEGLNGRGPDGKAGEDNTCVASSSNNNCNGQDGSDAVGQTGADGQGEDVKTAPGSRGSDGASSAPGAPGKSSAPSAPSAPSGPATGSVCSTRNGVKTCTPI